MKVAVYGTLRRGQRANGIIEGIGQYVGTGVITSMCRMVNLGYFPAICDNLDGDYKPVVDVYEVDDLAPLDYYEGYPRLYTRSVLNVALEDDEEIQATVYVMSDPNDTVNDPEVVGGDWTKRG